MNIYVERARIFADIAEERQRQDAKYQRTWDQDIFVMYAVLGEEQGEVARAILEQDAAAVRRELIELAAVAVAMIEGIDQRPSHAPQP